MISVRDGWGSALAALLSAGLFTAMPVTAASADSAIQLVARHSGKCVSVQDGRTYNGAPVVQLDCEDLDHQKWKLATTATPGYYNLRAANSNLCLSVILGSMDDNAIALQWNCFSYPQDDWRLVQKDGFYFSVENRKSGKCLTVDGGSVESAAKITQLACNEGANQHFSFSKIPSVS